MLLIEATGDVASTLPLFVAALAGHGAAACIAEPYDDVLLHMRKVPHCVESHFKNLYRRQIELVSYNSWTVRIRSPSSRRLERGSPQ